MASRTPPLPPLPPPIQEMLDNPPEGLVIYKYQGLDALEKAVEPISGALFGHQTEQQLMFVTGFGEKQGGDDIFNRRIFENAIQMYFWEHKLLILQFRPCYLYHDVENATRKACWMFSDSKPGLRMDSSWANGYLGLHSARLSDVCIFVDDYNPETESFTRVPWNWPTVAFEPRSLSPLSVTYMDFALDWWFYQSQGLTKAVVVYYIDHKSKTITFEKWVCDIITPPERDTSGSSRIISPLTGKEELPASCFKKRCESKTVYSEEGGFNGNPLVIELEMMPCAPRELEPQENLVIENKDMERYMGLLDCEVWISWYHDIHSDKALTDTMRNTRLEEEVTSSEPLKL